MTHTINQAVSVSSYYFSGRDMKTLPREIEYGGQTVDFVDGLRYLIKKSGEALRLFDMSGTDGLVYRLQQTGDNWTLLATKGAAR